MQHADATANSVLMKEQIRWLSLGIKVGWKFTRAARVLSADADRIAATIVHTAPIGAPHDSLATEAGPVLSSDRRA